MEIEVLNSKNKYLIDGTQEKERFDAILNFKENYKGYNEVFDALFGVQDSKLVNYCFISGAQDSKLFQLEFLDLSKRDFVKRSVAHVFDNHSAETVSIVSSNDASSSLIPLGFEDLGVEQESHLYLKDRTMEHKQERSK